MERIETDIAVIGAGPAGLGAALAAARTGARVWLADRAAGPGGTVAATGVDSLCGLFRFAPDSPPEWAPNPFAHTFAERLMADGGLAPFNADGFYLLPCPPEVFVTSAARLLAETPGIITRYGAELTHVQRDPDDARRLASLAFRIDSQPITVQAQSYVDATGAATLASLAGEATRDWGATQAAGYLARLRNVPPKAASLPVRLCLLRLTKSAIQAEKLSSEAACVAIAPWSPPGRLTLKWTLPPPDGQTRGPLDLKALTSRAHTNAQEFLAWLRAEVPGMAQAAWDGMGPSAGFRAGRVLAGRATLTRDALLAPPPVIAPSQALAPAAWGAWPLETWTPGRPSPRLTPLGAPVYPVPADCLRPQGLDNLFVTGRGLSADAEALASARVVGTALELGWAAGRLAVEIASVPSSPAQLAGARR